MERKFKLLASLCAGAMLVTPLVVNAAGLGKMTVISALGQPLRAEIELVAVQKDELDSVVARIASAEAYRQANIDRIAVLSGIKFSIAQKSNGESYLKVSSIQPINEPFLDMLVQLDWSAGRLLREFTILLDPPGFAETQAVAPVDVPIVKSIKPPVVAAPVAAAKSEPAAPVEEKPAVQAEAKPKKAAKPSQKTAPAAARTTEKTPSTAEQTFPKFEGEREVAPAKQAEAQTYGPVKKGQTLAAIAANLKPEGYSLDQMLVALYQSNKQSFAGNMNRLKTGQILHVPDTQQLETVDKAGAAKEVKVQAADWNAYRQKLAGAVAEEKAAPDAGQRQAASGKITTAVEDKAAAAREPAKDVLKLSKGEAPATAKGAAVAASGSKEGKALQDRLNSLQEEATAREKNLKEANARIAELEKSVKEMQRLIEIKNQNLAEAQKQAATTKAVPPAPAAPAPKPVPAPAAEKAPAVAAAPEKPLLKAIPEQPAAPKAEAPVAAKPAVSEAKPEKPAKPKHVAKPRPVAPPPAPERSLIEEIVGNPLYLAGGAIGIIGALIAALWAVGRKRRKSLASFEDSIMTGGDLKSNTVFGNTAGGAIDTGDTSFLTDFSQAGMGTIDTNDVDPIAEAEVYMAYGRDAQAEEILKEATAKDPNRHEIQLKLLEIYASRKNLTAFETLAAELYAAIGGQASPVWDKAAEMGRELDPANPLYSGGVPAPMVAPLEQTEILSDLAPAPVDEIQSEAPVAEMAEEPAEAEEMLSFDSSMEPAEPAAPMTEESDALDFNLDMGETIAEAPLEAAPAPLESDDGALDFVLDNIPEEGLENLADTISEEPVAEEPAAAPEMEELEAPLDFDLGTIIAPATELQPAEPASAGTLDELDMALDMEAPAAELEAAPAPAVEQESESIEIESPKSDDMGLDFDFSLDTEPAQQTETAASETPMMPDFDLSGIDLEMKEPAPAVEAVTVAAVEAPAAAPSAEGGQWEDAATKLDLAKAYMEMGDKEGAREILQEVVQEGGPEQQDNAKKLLASLS